MNGNREGYGRHIGTFWAAALLAVAIGGGAVHAGVVSPQPGEVYREYVIVMPNATEAWRVTDPQSPQPGAQHELPNPTFNFNIAAGELDHALRAELLVSYWGGHPGTVGQQFQFNGNVWLDIPSLTTTPQPPTGNDRPECYLQQWNPVTPVPLSQLRVGGNTLKGTSGGQTCYSFNWGQWGWYAAILRVYYNPSQVPNPTGAITAPVAGSTLLDNPTLQVAASGGGGVDRVEVLARTDDYDFDGDGVFADFQQAYHRPKTFDGLEISHHVGTVTQAPFDVTWDTTLVPDQDPGTIQFVARIRGANGLWYVTPIVGGLTLERTDRSVQLFKPENVPSRFWTREPRPEMSSNVTIPAQFDLNAVTSAKLLVRTWNGVDGAGPGTHFTRVNDWQIPVEYGVNHYYSADVLDVNPAALVTGSNEIAFGTPSTHHGIEILWPGPALLVTFAGTPQAYCGDGNVDPGEACDDGNLTSGDGCEADCTVTTVSEGLPALYPFDGGSVAVIDVSGNGNHGAIGQASVAATRTTAGRYGSGVRFNGVAGHVDLGGLDVPGNALTLAMWIKADDFGIEDARLISKAVSVQEQDHYWMLSTRANDNNPRLRLRLRTSNGGTETLESPGGLTAGTWTHVAATYDGSEMRLYQDGALVASAPKSGTVAQGSNVAAWIGDQPGGGKTFDGTIDEVVIDGRAYVEFEILQQMITPLGESGGNVCGNGLFDPGEECDDGNNVDGDGCQADCTDPACGDGIVDPGEGCDDGNGAIGDGCRPNCTQEICGDGFLDPGEDCDDGNGFDGDSCSANCVATASCGDGVVDPATETCDPPGSNAGQPNTCRSDCSYCGDGQLDVPPVPSEVLVDGGLEQWIVGVPDRWVATTQGGLVLRNTSSCFAGISCVLLRRQQGGELAVHQDLQSLQPGREYVLSFRARLEGGVSAQTPEIRLQNLTRGRWLHAGGSWSSSVGSAVSGGHSGENVWQVFTLHFDTPADSSAADTYRLSLTHDAAAGTAIDQLYDEVSLFGPEPDRSVQEQCDDGNNVDGDGCSADCRFEGCGDGVLDPGEACDDGNNVNGDGCSQHCSIESACGNGVLNTGEECDDGNNSGGDGCASDCTVEPFCGDGNVDPGEACDDGNNASGDGCSAGCAIEPFCGDGDADPGEECDDGNNANGDGCASDCTLESYCGDGNVDHGEACDDGNNINGDGCSASCFVEAACGDGNLDPGEACDDGNDANGDGCSADCTVEAFCGNGELDPGEACDDGNHINGDGCSAGCALENLCGNGIVDGGETPREWLVNGGFESWTGDSPEFWTVMTGGGTAVQSTTQEHGGESCAELRRSANDALAVFQNFQGLAPGKTYELTFWAKVRGGLSADTPQVKLRNSTRSLFLTVNGTWESDFPNALAGGMAALDRWQEFTIRFDVPGSFDIDDSYRVVLYHATPTIQWMHHFYDDVSLYGPLSTTAAEECDDGNSAAGDGCRPDCTVEECGDGIVDPGEDCDDGNTADGDDCSANCTLPGGECGDGFVDEGETCDPGDDNSRLPNACRSDCTYCGDGFVDEPPAPSQWLADSGIEGWWFGEPTEWTRTQIGGTAFNNPAQQHSGLSCLQMRRDGAGPLSVHQDIQGLEGGRTYELSFWFKIRTGEPGFRPSVLLRNMTQQESLRTDGAWGSAGPGLIAEGVNAINVWQRFSVRFTTPGTHAPTDTFRFVLYHVTAGGPDHYFDDVEIVGPLPEGPGYEACDDGNEVDGDGCRTDCTIEACGDGIVDPGEDCDDGNTDAGDGCSADCLSEFDCGDGVVSPPMETCDYAADNSGLPGGCRADCSYCGDGVLNVPPAPRDWLTDASFEAWSSAVPAHWTPFQAGGAVVRDTTHVQDGLSSLRLARDRAGALGAYQDLVGLFPGQSYELSFWFKLPGGDPGFRPALLLKNMTRQVSLRTDGAWGSAGPGLIDEGLTQPGVWQRFAVRFETPAGHSTDDVYRLALYHLVSNAPDHFFDGVQVHGPLADGPNFESCDDGNNASGDGCRADCTLEICGDGIVDAGEECDDGNTANGDGCSASCASEYVCGDGVVSAPLETCDTAADNSNLPGDCRDDCTYCGDGVVDEAPEATGHVVDGEFEGWPSTFVSDHWVGFGSGGVSLGEPTQQHTGQRSLRLHRNGSGSLGAYQDLDGLLPGHAYELSFWFKLRTGSIGFRPAALLKNMTRGQSLRTDGTWGSAGPGLVTEGLERMDRWQQFVVRFVTPTDHSADDTYRLAFYHLTQGASDHYYDDAQIYGPLPGGPNFEACDDGNQTAGDGCRADCTVEVCGDGIVDPGEDCDDGNTADGDDCPASCTIESVCGDGIVDAPFETCDPALDANCRADCTSCGDGYLDFPGPPSEKLAGGGLDVWADGAPVGWATTANAGSVTASSTEQISGESCAVVRRQQGGLLRLYQDLTDLEPGKTYELSFWAKVQGGVTPYNPHVRLSNQTRSLSLGEDGNWTSELSNTVRGGLTQDDTWQYFSLHFEVPADFARNDVYRLALLHGNSGLTTVDHFYDSVSVYGPLPLEFCDDGNTADGDGCSSSCQLE